MTAADLILNELLECGIVPEVSGDGLRILVPAGRLTDRQRRAILICKPELIERIRLADRLTAELLAAAKRACDHFNDGPAAREQMRQQCLATPPRLRAELRDHFNRQYGDAP